MINYSYALQLANDSNPYYVDNPDMFIKLLNRVIENPQHYAPTKSVNQPLRNWMNEMTYDLKIYKVNIQTFVILQGITKLPCCHYCGKTLDDKNFKNIYYGFHDFCCGKCRAKWDSDHWTQERHQQLSNAVRRGYQNMSQEKKLQLSKRISDSLHSRTPEQKKCTIDAYKQTCANRTKEQKAKISKHISDAYHNMIAEQKELKSKHLSYSLRNMDVEKKKLKNRRIGQKNHQNWINKTEAEKEAYREARRIAAENRTQETIDRMVDACNRTKRKNKSFNTSKPEEDAFQKLVTLFGINDVIRQYNCSRYPFNCDFYIKSRDLYIECNYFWHHGGHWFNEKDEEDLKKLQKWRLHNSKNYRKAIYVWTDLDIRKRNIAQQNNLNYIVFWRKEEFNDWISKEQGKQNEIA